LTSISDQVLELFCGPGGLSGLECAGLMLVSFSTSGITAMLGIGGGVLLLAVLASVLPIQVVVPVHGAIQLGSNATRAAVFRRNIDKSWLLTFGIGAAFGIYLGALLAPLPERMLKVMLAFCLLLSLWPSPSAGRPPSGRLLFLTGWGTSFLTMFAGGTGPLVAAILMGRSGRPTVIGTHAALMSLQHSMKIAAFSFLGFQFHSWIPFITVMIACGYLGAAVGMRLSLRLPETLFRSAFRTIIVLLAARLIWTALFAA